MGRRRVVNAAVALVVLASCLIYAVTDNDNVSTFCYLGVLIGAGVGAWIGAERAPRGQRLVPRLIAAGISLTALGDTLWEVLDRAGAGTDVSIADPPWFASYLFLCAALWVVLRRSTRGRADLDLGLDAVTIVVVSVLIMWSVSIGAIVADDSVSAFVRAVWASYPIADAVLLALVVRVLMSRRARAAIDASFAVGVCLWLGADLAYLMVGETGSAQVMMDLAWMVGPVLMARAAWRVADVQLDTSDATPGMGWVGQLVVAVGPLLVPAGLELATDLRGVEDHPVQLLVGTAMLMSLAFVRTGRLIRSEERAQRELEVARDAALAASRAKSMFLANMSHEIRTPLTTMLATAELLEDTSLDDFQLRMLAKMHRSGDLLKTLVEGILDFSQIEAGQLKLAAKVFDLHAVVAEATDVYMPRALDAGIRFEAQVDASVPRRVAGDPGRVFQILSNILENALKFTHDGHVSLVVRSPQRSESEAPEDVVEFVVSDTGIGIREEDQTNVFESFRQVDGSTTRRYGGNGLGLAICKELTELMGGSITFHSQFGAGTTFVVRVPLPDAARHRTAPLATLPAQSSSR
jgi:signal transduction histidine kinase